MRPSLLAALGAVVCALSFVNCEATQDFASARAPEQVLPAKDAAPAPLPCETQNDPANCGACGHSCLGGTCAAGRCQPALLARTHWFTGPVLAGQDRGFTAPIALVDGGVLWADEAGLWQVDRSGGVITKLARPTQQIGDTTYGAYIDQIIVHGGELFLLGHGAGRIWRAHLDGAALEAVVVDPEPNSITGFDVDDTQLVWGRWGGGLFTCPRAGCSGPPRALGESKDVFFVKLLGSEALYTAGYGIDTTFRSAPMAGGSSRVLAEGLGFVSGLQTDGTNAFVLGSRGFVLRMPIRGGDAKRDILTGSRVTVRSGIAVDASFVYWADEGQSAIFRAPKGGGAPEAIATHVVRPFAITTDDVAIYFTTQGSDQTGPQGTVMKLAKPLARR